MLKRVSIAAALLAGVVTADASQCKGLDQPACAANTACRWMPARVAGQTKKANGQPHKTSARAHCRLNNRAPAGK